MVVLALPIKDPLLPGKEDRRSQDGDEDEHIEERHQPDTLVDHGPGEHEDHLHIKGNKEQSQHRVTQTKLHPGLMTGAASILCWRILLWWSRARSKHAAYSNRQEAQPECEHEHDCCDRKCFLDAHFISLLSCCRQSLIR